MKIEGWTLEELADKSGETKNTVQKRIERNNITALFTGSIYPLDTFEKIKEATPGRKPKKP
ncbi:MAG: hypothetical protein FWC03_11735 [Treponema sp.]|nr:hypothetical protein [Treponema sp.]MCL2245115.1 hypothetical protein [Treponema sp.]